MVDSKEDYKFDLGLKGLTGAATVLLLSCACHFSLLLVHLVYKLLLSPFLPTSLPSIGSVFVVFYW